MQFTSLVSAKSDMSLLAHPNSLTLAGKSQVILFTQDLLQLVSLHIEYITSIRVISFIDASTDQELARADSRNSSRISLDQITDSNQ